MKRLANDGPNNMAADYTFDFTVANALFNDVYPETVIGNYAPNDFEVRFTEGGSYAFHAFTTGRTSRKK